MVAGVIGSDRLQYDLWSDSVSWWLSITRWGVYRSSSLYALHAVVNVCSYWWFSTRIAVTATN